MIKRMSITVKSEMGVWPDAISSGDGCGMVIVSKTKAAVIRICMAINHQRLVLMISTNGLQNGLIVHGRYSKDVNNAIWPLGTPIFVNIITEMLLTKK